VRIQRALLFALTTVSISSEFSVWAQDSPALPSPAAGLTENSTPATAAMSWQESAKAIDGIFEQSWTSQSVTPAPVTDDHEFLRRVYLDLAGRIPAAAEVRAFDEKPESERRTSQVEELLDSPAYVRNFTTVWRNALIPQASSQPEFRGMIPGFQAWLWQHVADNTPYDQMVREILTVPLGNGTSPGAVLNSGSSPEAFFLVRDLKPENLTTGTSRAFLGVRIDCAQCHDHPFDTWKQHQFWSLAAFYSGFQSDPAGPENAGGPIQENLDSRTIQIPGTDKLVPAVFLTGQEPQWENSVSSRRVLADWVTSDQNPYFARMVANRMWSQFFGQGIVHPVDDFSENNPPSHPEVLDLLASQLIAHDFDLKFLIRTITATQVYQLTSRQTHESQSDPSQFSRAALRGLTPEQFFDSLAEAVGYYQPYRTDNPFVLDETSPRGRFLELYRDDAESPLQRETTILQALAMMNGDFVQNATSLETSQTLRAIADFPLMSDADRLETLFLATLSRKPKAQEQAELGQYISSGGATGDARQSLTDVFWVLLNSSEFLLNH
jgi:hypothetical protein